MSISTNGSSGEITNASLIDITGTTTLNSDQLFNTAATATVKVEPNALLKLDGTKFNGGIITDNGTVEIAGFDAIVATTLNIGAGDYLTIDLGGTLFLSGTTISGGVISNLSSAPGIDVLGSSAINGGAQLNGGAVKIEPGQTLTFGNAAVAGSNATVSGTTISDPGTIQIAGGRTLTLAGTDTITGSIFAIERLPRAGTGHHSLADRPFGRRSEQSRQHDAHADYPNEQRDPSIDWCDLG